MNSNGNIKSVGRDATGMTCAAAESNPEHHTLLVGNNDDERSNNSNNNNTTRSSGSSKGPRADRRSLHSLSQTTWRAVFDYIPFLVDNHSSVRTATASTVCGPTYVRLYVFPCYFTLSGVNSCVRRLSASILCQRATAEVLRYSLSPPPEQQQQQQRQLPSQEQEKLPHRLPTFPTFRGDTQNTTNPARSTSMSSTNTSTTTTSLTSATGTHTTRPPHPPINNHEEQYQLMCEAFLNTLDDEKKKKLLWMMRENASDDCCFATIPFDALMSQYALSYPTSGAFVSSTSLNNSNSSTVMPWPLFSPEYAHATRWWMVKMCRSSSNSSKIPNEQPIQDGEAQRELSLCLFLCGPLLFLPNASIARSISSEEKELNGSAAAIVAQRILGRDDSFHSPFSCTANNENSNNSNTKSFIGGGGGVGEAQLHVHQIFLCGVDFSNTLSVPSSPSPTPSSVQGGGGSFSVGKRPIRFTLSNLAGAGGQLDAVCVVCCDGVDALQWFSVQPKERGGGGGGGGGSCETRSVASASSLVVEQQRFPKYLVGYRFNEGLSTGLYTNNGRCGGGGAPLAGGEAVAARTKEGASTLQPVEANQEEKGKIHDIKATPPPRNAKSPEKHVDTNKDLDGIPTPPKTGGGGGGRGGRGWRGGSAASTAHSQSTARTKTTTTTTTTTTRTSTSSASTVRINIHQLQNTPLINLMHYIPLFFSHARSRYGGGSKNRSSSSSSSSSDSMARRFSSSISMSNNASLILDQHQNIGGGGSGRSVSGGAGVTSLPASLVAQLNEWRRMYENFRSTPLLVLRGPNVYNEYMERNLLTHTKGDQLCMDIHDIVIAKPSPGNPDGFFSSRAHSFTSLSSTIELPLRLMRQSLNAVLSVMSPYGRKIVDERMWSVAMMVLQKLSPLTAAVAAETFLKPQLMFQSVAALNRPLTKSHSGRSDEEYCSYFEEEEDDVADILSLLFDIPAQDVITPLVLCATPLYEIQLWRHYFLSHNSRNMMISRNSQRYTNSSGIRNGNGGMVGTVGLSRRFDENGPFRFTPFLPHSVVPENPVHGGALEARHRTLYTTEGTPMIALPGNRAAHERQERLDGFATEWSFPILSPIRRAIFTSADEMQEALWWLKRSTGGSCIKKRRIANSNSKERKSANPASPSVSNASSDSYPFARRTNPRYKPDVDGFSDTYCDNEGEDEYLDDDNNENDEDECAETDPLALFLCGVEGHALSYVVEIDNIVELTLVDMDLLHFDIFAALEKYNSLFKRGGKANAGKTTTPAGRGGSEARQGNGSASAPCFTGRRRSVDKTLQRLVVSSCCNLLWKPISGLVSLRVLCLCDLDITNRDFLALGKCSALEAITVIECVRVTDMSVLGQLPRLKKLVIDSCRVSDDGLSGLRYSKSLTTLFFHGSCHRVIGTSFLLGSRSIQRLHLTGTQVTNEGILPLSHCTTLKWISLAGCKNITDVNCLGALPHLVYLELFGTSVKNHGLTGLLSLTSLQFLDLTALHRVVDLGFAAQLHHLTFLDLSETNVKDAALESLSHCYQLVVFRANYCCELTSINPIFSLPSIRDVSAVVCRKLTADGIRLLSTAASLRLLVLHGCSGITTLPDLSALQQLREVIISSTGIGDEGVQQMRFCRQLSVLIASNCSKLFSLGEELGQNADWSAYRTGPFMPFSNLRIAVLRATKVTVGGIAVLSQCKNLELLDLSWCSQFTSFSRGQNGTGGTITTRWGRSLRYVNLSNSGITGNGAIPLSVCTALQTLRLREVSKLQFNFLHSLTRLKLLDVSCSGITNDTLGLLAASSRLTSLSAMYAQITDVGPLLDLPMLTELDFSHSSIGNVGVRTLRHIRTLKKIVLRGCKNVTDVSCLFGMPELEVLEIFGTGVT